MMSEKPRRHFASANYAGICPEALTAMLEANHGHEISYGDDSWTAKASDLPREVFETNCEVFFVFNAPPPTPCRSPRFANPITDVDAFASDLKALLS